jgi:hypothetical protein
MGGWRFFHRFRTTPRFDFSLAARLLVSDTAGLFLGLALGSRLTLLGETLFLFGAALCLFLRAPALLFLGNARIFQGAQPGYFLFFGQRAQHHPALLGLDRRRLCRLGRLRDRRRRSRHRSNFRLGRFAWGRYRGLERIGLPRRAHDGRTFDLDHDSFRPAVAESLTDNARFRTLDGQGFGRTRGMQCLVAIWSLIVSHARLSIPCIGVCEQ